MKIIVTCSICGATLVSVSGISDDAVNKEIANYQQSVSCNQDGTAGITITTESES